MPNRWIKRTAAVILACCLAQGSCITSMAATKPIKSVSVRVNSKLEAGSTLPGIDVGTGTPEKGKVMVSGGNSKYHVSGAEWVDKAGEELKSADEPRMKVTLEPEDVGEDYFLASYKSSEVKISGGTFVSARRDGDNLVVTLRVNGVKGEYDPPGDAFWNEKNLGEARWDKPENTSGYYELQLFRDGKSVHKVSKTSSNRYNFYPYMTKEGDYTFKVRTIPSTDVQVKYGKKSEWVESGELQITDRYVSDGKGQQKKDGSLIRGTADTVGWVKEEDGWNYRYPDGSLGRGGWELIDGLWYYFNMDGLMLTGWQNVDGRYYYLQPDGQMAVGWARVGQQWYYFRPEEEAGEPVGSMAGPGWKVIGPYYYYFNDDGSLYTGWLSLNGKRYYLNTVDNSLQGAMFTGWIIRDGQTFYADSNGELVEGWCQIDGNWYYFYPGSYEMARDTRISGFYVNQDGIWTQ